MAPHLCPLLSFSTGMMAMLYKLVFSTALPFPNQIHPFLPHPRLCQWWMAAFTHLSPLHISLPIRLTTHIHTSWLFIPLSFHLPQSSCSFHSSSACHTTGFHFPPILHPSLLHLVYPSPIFSFSLIVFHAVSLCLHHSFGFCFHIQ